MKKAEGFGFVLLLGIVGNILSVVGVVICNKLIMTRGFHFTMILSAMHFAVTWLGCCILLQCKYFKYKKIAFFDALPVASSSLASVAFSNLNLAYNSVGFYQLSKLICIPFTIVIQRLFFRTDVTWQVKLTLIPILGGVGLATVHDVSVNPPGTIFGILAIVSTSIAQIFTQRYQKALEADALQLLFVTAPIIFVGMLVMAPFFDPIMELATFTPSTSQVIWIGISALLAFGVNVTNYLVLGMTSPLTYQVLGHLKTILILFLGYQLFQAALDSHQALGIVIAMGGVIMYTEVKRRQSLAGGRLPR